MTQSRGDLVAENERLAAIVRECWRFWAAVQGSFVDPTMLDRGYVTIRVSKGRYQAFDAIFRASASMAVKDD